MTINVLDKLYHNGDLRSLVLSGVLTVNALEWRKIYHSYFNRIKEVGKTQAITDTADTFNISERSVYRVLEKMKYKHEANKQINK